MNSEKSIHKNKMCIKQLPKPQRSEIFGKGFTAVFNIKINNPENRAIWSWESTISNNIVSWKTPTQNVCRSVKK